LKEFDDLNKYKKAVMEERDKEKAEKEGDKPAYNADYISQITTIASKIEHHMGIHLQAVYIDAVTVIDNRLNEVYISYINNINNFLRIFEKTEGEVREEAIKEAVIKLRFVFLEAANNLIRPIIKKYEESKEYPTKNIDTLKSEWNAQIAEFKDVADKVYDSLDTKNLFI
jgi:hypothetical protein